MSDIAAVALGAIGNKDLIFVHFNAARAEIVIGDSLAKKIVALFRTVAMEGLDARHIVDSRMHRIDYGRRQRSSHIAYAHFYQVCIGMAPLNTQQYDVQFRQIDSYRATLHSSH